MKHIFSLLVFLELQAWWQGVKISYVRRISRYRSMLIQYNFIRNVSDPGFPPMFIDLYCDRSATTVLTAAAWNMRQQHLFEESLVWIKMRGTHSSKTGEKWKMKRVRCTFTFPGTRRCLGLRIPLTLKGTTALDSLPPCCMFSNLIRLLHTHYFYFLRRLPHNHYSTVFYWQKCRWSLDSRPTAFKVLTL